MSTVAIGDIHGNALALADLLGKIRPDLTAADTVVFLGDYVDRGADSRGCLDAILRFRDETPARVVGLLGNHEDWMLRTALDPTDHGWWLAMDALPTVASYDAAAADALRDAAVDAGTRLHGSRIALPYERFWNAVPEAHLAFLRGLRTSHETPECVCVHAGLNPRIARVDLQPFDALVWGRRIGTFPDNYRGTQTVVYGHHNNAVVGDDGWPAPRRVGATIGLDTSRFGVVSAVRLPEDVVIQSGCYVEAVP